LPEKATAPAVASAMPCHSGADRAGLRVTFAACS